MTIICIFNSIAVERVLFSKQLRTWPLSKHKEYIVALISAKSTLKVNTVEIMKNLENIIIDAIFL